MRRFVFALAAIALACQHGGPSASDGADVIDPAFVLPGPFSEETSVADLEARFGVSHVQRGTEPDGAGGTAHLLLLFPDDPTRRATVRFHCADLSGRLASITVTEPNSRWRGKHGVRVGASLAQLREKNGRAFYFMGFDADGDGRVRDAWDVGALDVVEGERLYFGVDLRLREPGSDVARPGEYEQTSSDDPATHISRAGEPRLRLRRADDVWSRRAPTGAIRRERPDR